MTTKKDDNIGLPLTQNRCYPLKLSSSRHYIFLYQNLMGI